MKKKILLSMLLAATFGFANAQTNLVDNGDFEAAVTKTWKPYSWLTDTYPEKGELPGWDNTAANQWNGIPNIIGVEPDGDIIEDDNTQALRLQRWKDKGWYDVSVSQTIPVVAGTPYTFSTLYRYNEGIDYETNGISQPVAGYKIYDGEAGGTVLIEDETLKSFGWNQLDPVEFTPTKDNIVVYLYINNNNYNGDWKSESTYIDFDNVEVLGQVANGITSVSKNANSLASVYDIAGREVMSSVSEAQLRNANLKGVYLVKKNGVVKKQLFR